MSDPEKRAPMGRMDRTHLSRYLSAEERSLIETAYAHLDILGTVNESGGSHQNSGRDSLSSARAPDVSGPAHRESQMPGGKEDGEGEVEA